MIFINVTLKFHYKPIIRNNFIYKTTLTKKGKLNRKMSLYAFLFFVRYNYRAKSPRKNVKDMGVKLWSTFIPSGLVPDRASLPS